jgi:hypothetical protein
MRLIEVAVVVGTIGLGLALVFGGYRWSRLLLPAWTFAFGAALGGILVAVTFSERFLSTGTALIVGGICGPVLLILALLYPTLPGILLIGGLGASLGAAVASAAGVADPPVLASVALLAGVAGGALVLALRSPRWLMIAATAICGASLVAAGLRVLLEPGVDQHGLRAGAPAALLAGSPSWGLLAVALAVAGAIVQVRLGPEVRPLPRLPGLPGRSPG